MPGSTPASDEVQQFREAVVAAILADLVDLQELMGTTTYQGNIEDRHRQQVRATALGWGMKKAADVVNKLSWPIQRQ